MAYERIDWENEPSVDTPLNEDNLNHMDEGIANLDSDVAGKMDANNPTGTGSLQVGTGNMKTDGNPSYALGYNAYAEGDNSFAFGSSTRAKKQGAYAIGTHAEAREYFSMALGEEVIAASIHQTVRGKYNEIDADGVYLDIVGGGNPLERKNVETLTPNGDKWVAGDYTNGNGETLHGIYEALPVDSASGNPAVITDAFGGLAKSLKLTLEPIQSGSGTPSPSNVRPISGRTQSVMERATFNLYDATKATAGTIISAVNGTESANANYDATDYIMVGGGTSYYIKITDVQASQRGMAWYDANKTFISGASAKNGVYGVQVAPDNAVYMRVSVPKTDATPCINVSSSRDGEYEPYSGESITRTYGTTIYGGTDDVTGEGLASDWYLKDGLTRGSLDSSGKLYQINYTGRNIKTHISTSDATPYIKCSHLEVLSLGDARTLNAPCICQYSTSIYIGGYVGNESALDTLLASNNFQVCVEVGEPVDIPLTAQNINLLHGDNVLTTDADSIETSYSADIALYIAKKIAEGISQGNRSLSKGGSSEPEEEPKEEEIKEEVKEEVKKEETKEEIKEEPTQEK